MFDVAFPHENHFTAYTRGHNSLFSSAAKASMRTTMTGVDQATQQRITDKAYALFVAQLTEAGYEVVDQATDEGSGDYTVAADAAKFEVAADEVVSIGVPKLVGAMAASK